jgi:hypothetical protein
VFTWLLDLLLVSNNLSKSTGLHTFGVGGGRGFLFFPVDSASIEAGESCPITICGNDPALGDIILGMMPAIAGSLGPGGAGRIVTGAYPGLLSSGPGIPAGDCAAGVIISPLSIASLCLRSTSAFDGRPRFF